MKAKYITKTRIEPYTPKWNTECTKFGLTEEEQKANGYMDVVEIEASDPIYYEVIDNTIYQKIDTEESIKRTKESKLQELSEYDKSVEVNSFSLNGLNTWVDRETRSSLFMSVSMEKSIGMTSTTIIIEGNSLEIPIDICLGLLTQIELYAKVCYIQTQKHISSINDINTKSELEAYDFTVGYPNKIDITI